MHDYDICTRKKGRNIKEIIQILEENEMKVLRKIVGKTKIEKEANKSENPAVSNLLLNEWKRRRRKMG
jgi:hypothetical protein